MPLHHRRPDDSSRPEPHDPDDRDDHERAEPEQYEESMKEEAVLESAANFVDLVNELNQHLSQLEYALLDLKEVLVQCDSRESGILGQEAALHIERIRSAAKDDPGFPPLSG